MHPGLSGVVVISLEASEQFERLWQAKIDEENPPVKKIAMIKLARELASEIHIYIYISIYITYMYSARRPIFSGRALAFSD